MDYKSDEIEEKYMCPICMDVLEKPHTIEKCRHSLCGGCLESLITSVTVRQKYEKKKAIILKYSPPHSRCPMCQGEFTKKEAHPSEELVS